MIINNIPYKNLKTKIELDNVIDEIRTELAFQERCLYSSDVLKFACFEPKFFDDLNNELIYFQRISNKLFNKWLKTI